ncbi:hypothetical protein AKJ39_04540 [candidate division MSBL1 archaeon SCGC-AAA259J03]|uniref:Uncharacterized protein n=1 Tax=candidate division MSBL1 archaeon SCGC-AAA259J03 TaxID=1698269 RepID=A0A656YVD1_9EURY|nr:hypothetical protein AKJ39_04540 [candidate division MSBL1 archaeon SCGC-AAA259J03]
MNRKENTTVRDLTERAQASNIVGDMSISIGGPYPSCPECEEGNFVPVLITEEGEDTGIDWECTNCGHRV